MLKMKKHCLLAIVFSFLVPATLANQENCNTITVGGGNWLSIQELNNLRGSAAGSSILLLHKLPELLSVNIEYDHAAPFARQLHQLKKGELDVVAGIYPTLERQKHYLFTDNYYYEKLFIFAKPEKIEQLTNINQLKNAVGAIIRGASYGPTLDKLYKNKSSSIQVNNQTQRLNLLLRDRVDYFVGTITAVGYSQEMTGIAISNKPIHRQGVALGFSPKTACKRWIPQINNVIESNFISK